MAMRGNECPPCIDGAPLKAGSFPSVTAEMTERNTWAEGEGGEAFGLVVAVE